MRRAIEEKKNTKAARFILAAFFVFECLSWCSERLMAQELPKEITEILEERVRDIGFNLESEGVSGIANVDNLYQNTLELYEDYLTNPLNINMASRRELESLLILSDFQVESLLEYIDSYGAIISKEELLLVDGFNQKLINILIPYISFKEFSVSKESKWKSRWRLRYKNGGYAYTSYKLKKKNFLESGFLLENDRGEKKIPDFTSFYLCFLPDLLGRKKVHHSNLKIKKILLGDYSLRFAQGLALWNTFSFSGAGHPSSMIKRNYGISPYTSSTEQGFFRGFACELKVGENIDVSAFSSFNKHDARVEGDSYYSFPETGLHDTEYALENKRTLNSILYGTNLTCETGLFQLGLTSAFYRFDKHNERRVYDYNRYQMFDGWWSNYSFNIIGSFGRVRVFSELAMDHDFTPAVIAGCIFPVSKIKSINAGVNMRYYPKDYIALYSGAISSSTKCANEDGCTFDIEWNPKYEFKVSAYVNYAYFPWVKFGIDSPSSKMKANIALNYTFENNANLVCSYQCNYKDYNDSFRNNLRCGYRSSTLKKVIFECRGEVNFGSTEKKNSVSELLYAGVTLNRDKLKVSYRLTGFWAKSWSDRIYCYEYGLPGSFSVPSFYGKGASTYVVIKYEPFKWIRSTLKGSYSYDFKSRKNKEQLKLQLDFKF